MMSNVMTTKQFISNRHQKVFKFSATIVNFNFVLAVASIRSN